MDPSLFAHVHHADGTDQSTSRAMGVALWPATMGYWMESMMAPVFPQATVDVARTFFTRYVVASGSVPAVRIGSQPYGILPTAAVSRMRWMFLDDEAAARDPLFMFCHRMYPIVRSMQQDWRAQAAHVVVHRKARRSAPDAARHPRPAFGIRRVVLTLCRERRSRCSTG